MNWKEKLLSEYLASASKQVQDYWDWALPQLEEYERKQSELLDLVEKKFGRRREENIYRLEGVEIPRYPYLHWGKYLSEKKLEPSQIDTMFIDLCIPSLTEFQKPSDKIEEYVKDAKGEQEIDLFRIYCFSKIEAVAKARENDTNPLAYVKEINAIISQAQDDALSYEGGSKLLYAHKTPVYEPITRHDMHGCGCMMFVLIGSQITSVALQVVTKYIKDNPETISSAGKLGLVSAACILGVAASLGFIASLNGITYIQDRIDIAKGPQDFMEVMQQQAKMLWDERQEELSEKRAVAA